MKFSEMPEEERNQLVSSLTRSLDLSCKMLAAANGHSACETMFALVAATRFASEVFVGGNPLEPGRNTKWIESVTAFMEELLGVPSESQDRMIEQMREHLQFRKVTKEDLQ